jgi:peptidyl-prolyl cis-trans isomerase SurA
MAIGIMYWNSSPGSVSTKAFGLLLAGLLASMLGPGAGLAQSDGGTGIPGLMISNSPPPRPLASPQPAVQEKAKPKPGTQAKPKAAAPQRQANAETPEKPSPRIGGQGIVVLINDEPVTAYEVEQRATFLAVSGGGTGITERARENLKHIAQQESTNQRMRAILDETIKANPGKTREQVIAAFEERKKVYVQSLQRQALDSARASLLPSFKKSALEELIEERLKLQEAKRLNINVSEEEGDKFFKGIAERNKMTEQQFAEHLKGQGIDPQSMKARLRAQSVWRDVIRRKFGHQVSVTAREVDKLVGSSASGEEHAELQLHKITLATPGKLDQRTMARRLEEAEALRRKFAGCKSTASLAKGASDASFEDLGFKKADTVTEPTRSLLLNAKEGEMVPGNLAPSGVELYAVCARRTAKVDDQKRQQVESELTQKEFDVLARRHLRDLRQDAMIEYR